MLLSQIHLSELWQISSEKVIKPQHNLFGPRRVIAYRETPLLNDFSYCFFTIIKARNVFLMAHLTLKLHLLLASHISGFRDVKIILIQFRHTAQDKTTSTYDSTDCTFQISNDSKALLSQTPQWISAADL